MYIRGEKDNKIDDIKTGDCIVTYKSRFLCKYFSKIVK